MTDERTSQDMIREGLRNADKRHGVLPRVSSERTLKEAIEGLTRELMATYGVSERGVGELVEHEKKHAQKYLERMKLKPGIAPDGAFGYMTHFGRPTQAFFSHKWDHLDYDDLLHIGCAPSDMGSSQAGRDDVEMVKEILRAKRKGEPFEDFRKRMGAD